MTAAKVRQGMTRKQYADHRKISAAMVTKLGKQKLLVLFADKSVDQVSTDRVVSASQNPMYGSAAIDAKTEYMAAKTEEAKARAMKARIEAEQAAGNLVERDAVHKIAYLVARLGQQALITLIDRNAEVLAEMTDPLVVHNHLMDEARTLCESMSENEMREAIDGIG